MQLLELLPRLGDLLQGHNDIYASILWQYVHCPAWGTLWGHTLVKGKAGLKESDGYLETMENLPEFLNKLSPRNPLVVKLGSITGKMLRHLKSALYLRGKCSFAQASRSSPWLTLTRL